MLITRKQTLPERQSQEFQFGILNNKKQTLHRYKGHSQMINLKKIQQTLTEKQGNKENKQVSYQRIRNFKKMKEVTMEEAYRVMSQNKLQIHLLEDEEKTKNLGVISFKKIQNLLLPKGIIEQIQYKSHNRIVKSVLEELERDQLKFQEIERSKKCKSTMQKIASKTLQKLERSQECGPEVQKLKKKCIEQFHIKKQFELNLKKRRQNKSYFSKFQGEKKQQQESKWKLSFFLDSIIEEHEMDKERISKLNQKFEIAKKIRDIGNQCQKLQNELKLSKSLSLFSRYSEHLSEELIKRQKKLTKFNSIFT